MKTNILKILSLTAVFLFSSVEGYTESILSEDLAKARLDFYKVNNSPTHDILTEEQANEFNGQCSMYIRPLNIETKKNDVKATELYNPEIYTQLTGGASVVENLKTGSRIIFTSAHQITDRKYADGNIVKTAHKATQLGDIVLLKCGARSFFAKVRVYAQIRSNNDDLINSDQAIGMNTDFEDGKDFAKLDPVDKKGKISPELLNDIKASTFMKVIEKNKEGIKNIFSTSEKYGYVVQFNGTIENPNNDPEISKSYFDANKMFRAKSKCRIDQSSVYLKKFLETAYNESNILGIKCDGPVKMVSGSPVYLGKANSRNNEIEKIENNNNQKVAVGLLVSGAIVEKDAEHKNTETYIDIVVLGQSNIN